MNEVKEILPVATNGLTIEEIKNLDRHGFILLPPARVNFQASKISLNKLDAIINRILKKEGTAAGIEAHFGPKLKKGEMPEKGVNRLSLLVKKDDIFLRIMEMPILLSAAETLIKGDFKLSDMELREPTKGYGFQRLHIDGAVRKIKSEPATMAVCFLYLDNSTVSNGAISIVPGSHKSLKNPKEVTETLKPHPREKIIEAQKGSLLILDPSIWHRGRENQSGSRRRTLLINYRSRRFPQQVHMKSYFNTAEIRELTASQRYLLSLNSSDPNFFLKRLVFRYRKNPVILGLVKLKQTLRRVFNYTKKDKRSSVK
jgi:hypothetical protein